MKSEALVLLASKYYPDDYIAKSFKDAKGDELATFLMHELVDIAYNDGPNSTDQLLAALKMLDRVANQVMDVAKGLVYELKYLVMT